MFLFWKKKKEEPKSDGINKVYTQLKELYPFEGISAERKKYLEDTISEHGYLNIPYIRALEELTPAEILYGLEIKWENQEIFVDGVFKFENKAISALARKNVKNADWLKKEGHDIKLINLAGLGDGNKTKEPGKFMDWLRQLLILPTGNEENNIFNTTMYLIPFHPREFGCAYLPKSSEVSENLLDKTIEEHTGLNVQEQVKTFITLAQLAGHPVIYDILPQTGRFSKAVLAKPEIARWYDIPALEKSYLEQLDKVTEELAANHDREDIDLVKDIYLQSMHGGEGDLAAHFKAIFDEFESAMNKVRKRYSNEMLSKSNQTKLHKRVRGLVNKINRKPSCEEDITNQLDIINALIGEGLWPAPGGAWCSAGVPVFDKMSQCGGYPTFKHYDYKDEDVTTFANLDCQTPYYLCHLENGSLNAPVVKYFVDYMKKLQKEYNFDGYRVDHIDHIVDPVSEKDGKPISYRAPRVVLDKLNKTLKKEIPHFAALAEYMLWDDFLKEYHQDMDFDVLWGNDIVMQYEKTPEKIIENNQHLANYNVNFREGKRLSILKTYNNQDGEFRAIDQYPGQLEEDGALYKWFKYKTLPGGKFAQRPMFYIDGDESFTKRGIESVIGDEISMAREDHPLFFAKFDAIDRFVKSQNIITDGEAHIIAEDEDGFSAWMISKDPLRKAFLMVSNSKYPSEKVNKTDDGGNSYTEIVHGEPIHNKALHLPGECALKAEYIFDGAGFAASKIKGAKEGATLNFETLNPGEFRIYEIKKG